MKQLIAPILSILILLSFTACNLGGFTEVGEENDPTTPMGDNSQTYFRTASDGVVNTVELITMQNPGGTSGEIALFQLDDDSSSQVKSVVMVRATYTEGGGNLTIFPYFRYENEYKSKDPQSTAQGATREEYPAGFSTVYSNYAESLGTSITVGGLVYTWIGTVHQTILDETNAGTRADMMMRLFDLTMIYSQSKIKGFGSTGTVIYLGKTSQFKGTRTGTFNFSPSGISTITTHFDYTNYSDFENMTVNGRQTSVTNRSGDGSMADTVSFAITGASGPAVDGSVEFDAIVLTATVSSSGTYGVTIVGPVESVDHNENNPGFTSYDDLDPIPTTALKLTLPDIP
jgi:hypothetical protein